MLARTAVPRDPAPLAGGRRGTLAGGVKGRLVFDDATLQIDRRSALVGLIGMGTAGLLTACGSDSSESRQPASPNSAPPTAYDVAPALLDVTVFKDPTCGCCGGWVDHAESNGLSVAVEETNDLERVFLDHAVPTELQSCHLVRNTAGTIFVGHVPVRFVLQYLADPPRGSRGLSVPGMPVGAPGMEMGDQLDPYEVLLVGEDGPAGVFATVERFSDQAL